MAEGDRSDMAEGRGPVVEDHPSEERLTLEEGGKIAELRYHRDGDRLSITHTGVPAALEGRGLGSALVSAAVDLAAVHGLTVVPQCSFARWWLETHPDAQATVTIDWP